MTTDAALNAERSVIGSVLLDNRIFWKVSLAPSDFHDEWNGWVWGKISTLLKQGEQVDPLILGDHLEGPGDLQAIGNIVKSTFAPKNAETYAGMVKTAARKRNATVALKNALASLEDGGDVDEVTTDAMGALQGTLSVNKPYMTLGDCLRESADEARAMREAKGGAGISSQVGALDHFIGGFRGPKLIVLGGRPGTYKTAIALQVLLGAAGKGVPTGIISKEMAGAELGVRAVANICGLDNTRLAQGDKDEWSRVRGLSPEGFSDWPLYVDDSSFNLSSDLARIQEWKYKHDIQMAVVDHMQLLGHSRGMSRFEELSEASRQYKLLAKRLNIPVMVLSQLSRDVEKENREPRDSDLRECGNLEQDADMIIFSHVERGKGQEADKYCLLLSKNRGGPARKRIPIRPQGALMRIAEAFDVD